MTITHATVATGADDPSKEINKGEWNADHTVSANTLVASKLAASATDILFGRSSSGAGAGEEIACTAAGRALLDDAAASNQRTTLGLGTIATQDANNVSITGGSITGTTGAEYTLQFAATSGNPNDGVTYFIGLLASLTAVSASGVLKIPIPLAGTVVRIDLHVGVGGTLGTTEAATVSFRLNNTTDTTISSAVLTSATSQLYAAAVSITVAAGDYFEIKWVSPTWSTNPTAVIVNGTVTVRR